MSRILRGGGAISNIATPPPSSFNFNFKLAISGYASNNFFLQWLTPHKTKRRMDRLRRSLRESFRRKKDHVPECSKPHQWQADEQAVRSGTCNFHVKYLGCVEVYESRGMQVCEEALKVLRNSRRKPIKGVLNVTGDGLRVIDDDTKGLIVDQTIEKVSFCAPDRNHDRGFSYICRDGTTRRWMCHGFLATKEVGERLSHAVGCAFAVCLEKKQKRDKECGVQMSFDPTTSTFTRTGSFRQTTITERLQDPQECKPAPEPTPANKSVHNPYAVQRPHATPSMLERQGSFRSFNQLNQTSPFKRQLSLRLNELPSTLERQQQSLSVPEARLNQNGSNKLSSVSPIPESSPMSETGDSISAMCQQVTQGLSLLSKNEDQTTSNTGNPWATSVTEPVVASSNVTNKESSRAQEWLASSYKTTNLPLNKPLHDSGIPVENSSYVRRAPNLGNLRSQSVGSNEPSISANINYTSQMKNTITTSNQTNGNFNQSNSIAVGANDISKPRDPFDAEWAAIATRHEPLSPTNSTNPFQPNRFQAFEVQM
ncbi:Protein numb [Nymphon striatum]|nr:Protein numb [Nymphon striatum]